MIDIQCISIQHLSIIQLFNMLAYFLSLESLEYKRSSFKAHTNPPMMCKETSHLPASVCPGVKINCFERTPFPPLLTFFFHISYIFRMSQATTRLGQLTQLSCKVFSNIYNPTCARTGNKIIRQRLIGSTLTGYNPKKLVHFRDIQALYPQLGLVNLEEKERLDEIARRKRRGKGAPKKGKVCYSRV